MAHYQGRIYWRDVHFEKKNNKYDRIKAYTQSKLANVMHARELALRLEGSGIRVVSLHPGASIFCHMYLYLLHYIIFHLSTFLMGSCSFNWRSTPFYNFGTWYTWLWIISHPSAYSVCKLIKKVSLFKTVSEMNIWIFTAKINPRMWSLSFRFLIALKAKERFL